MRYERFLAYAPMGQEFESLRARQIIKGLGRNAWPFFFSCSQKRTTFRQNLRQNHRPAIYPLREMLTGEVSIFLHHLRLFFKPGITMLFGPILICLSRYVFLLKTFLFALLTVLQHPLRQFGKLGGQRGRLPQRAKLEPVCLGERFAHAQRGEIGC